MNARFQAYIDARGGWSSVGILAAALFASFTFLIRVLTSLAPSTTFIHPEVSADVRRFDFGSASANDVVEHVFVIRNNTSSSITVASVKLACGCTSVIKSPVGLHVESNTTFQIPLRLKLPDSDGDVSKSAFVSFEEFPGKSLELVMFGRVVATVQVEPRVLNLGAVDVNAAIEKTISIRSVTDAAVEVRSIQSSHAHVSCSRREVSATHTDVTIALIPPLNTGRHSVNVFIEFSTPAHKSITVPVNFAVTAE